jgi:hypothetical protein
LVTLGVLKTFEWLQACGELSIGQLDDPVKLNQALSRVAFDLLVYLHARAEELRREDDFDAVLELHSSIIYTHPTKLSFGRSTREDADWFIAKLDGSGHPFPRGHART